MEMIISTTLMKPESRLVFYKGKVIMFDNVDELNEKLEDIKKQIDAEIEQEVQNAVEKILADAGLNQGTIKQMVETQIKNKTDRAIDQCIKSLNSECSSGDYFKERISSHVSSWFFNDNIRSAVKEELKNKVIQVVLKDCEINEVEKVL